MPGKSILSDGFENWEGSRLAFSAQKEFLEASPALFGGHTNCTLFKAWDRIVAVY